MKIFCVFKYYTKFYKLSLKAEEQTLVLWTVFIALFVKLFNHNNNIMLGKINFLKHVHEIKSMGNYFCGITLVLDCT